MKGSKWLILGLGLGMMGLGALALSHLRAHQRLGLPGVRTTPLPGKTTVTVDLPEAVLNYRSEALEVDKYVLNFLPSDTSFGKRMYLAPDGFGLLMQAVLMGMDRTSLHKPEFCLSGQGWHIDRADSGEELVPVQSPYPYDLPVMKFLCTKPETVQGRTQPVRGLFVFWFVTDGKYTAQHNQRMWWTVTDLVRTGVLDRWAYISCFSKCLPGQEDATFERMKKFIGAAVPAFQLAPAPMGAGPPLASP